MSEQNFHEAMAQIARQEAEHGQAIPSWVAQSPAALQRYQIDAEYRLACQQAPNGSWRRALIRRAEDSIR